MSLPTIRDRQEGFSGGLNTTSDDSALKPNECRVALNAQLDRRGAIRKRFGSQRVASSAFASPVIGGVSWARTTSVQEVVVSGGKVFTGTLSIPTTWTDRGGSLSTSVYPSFAVFKGPTTEGVYIADGGLLNFWDGTTLTQDITNTPALESIVAWGPRLFGFKDDTVYWSSTTGGINGHTLGAVAGGGQAVVRTYGGQELIAGAPLKNSLILFHRNAVSRFTGSTSDDINIQAGTQGISGDVGTVAKRSIVGVENAVYFLSDRGVFAATEMDVTAVSSPLESTLANLSKNDWLKVSASHARAFNEIRWFIPGVGVYAFNYRTNGWTGPFTGSYLSSETLSMWDTRDADGKSVVLSGHANGHVLWNDRRGLYLDDVLSGSTGGVTYPFEVQCRRFFGADYTTQKSWRSMYLLGEFPDPANVTCTIDTEGAAITVPLPYSIVNTSLVLAWGHPSTVWGAPGTAWGGDGGVAVERANIPLHGTFPWVDAKISYTGANGARISIVDVIGFMRSRR